MAKALCLSYQEDIAAAQALVQAKRLYDVNETISFNSSSNQTITKTINVGTFTSAVFIGNRIPYGQDGFGLMGLNRITSILPNMQNKGIFGFINGSTTECTMSDLYMSNIGSFSGCNTQIKSTTDAVIFTIALGRNQYGETFTFPLQGTIAVLS